MRRVLVQREQQAVSRRGDAGMPGHCQQRSEAIGIEQRQSVGMCVVECKRRVVVVRLMACSGGSAINAVEPHCAASGRRHAVLERAQSTA
ncbi:hypothetical protein FPL06_00585 [Xanthomonas citri pv. glycines]|nr:hypothetical protein FPK90_01440 [Xanthomonas citri pv. glycines]QDS05716.1 hypothetical protein FPL00_01455 [Xanthomonas citri pv. glycines]QDS10001.1 hypothetical protein FPL03_01445 [Xanthomonas citri pv. glycines]QDS18630.1 hypothetical protein FPL05_01605 [Xanthomonas citri pv. glycines]TSJ93199.1 hypothetical protein FPK99_00610 [Xanthomonas citri pv. glycines]